MNAEEGGQEGRTGFGMVRVAGLGAEMEWVLDTDGHGDVMSRVGHAEMTQIRGAQHRDNLYFPPLSSELYSPATSISIPQ